MPGSEFRGWELADQNDNGDTRSMTPAQDTDAMDGAGDASERPKIRRKSLNKEFFSSSCSRLPELFQRSSAKPCLLPSQQGHSRHQIKVLFGSAVEDHLPEARQQFICMPALSLLRE